MTNRKVRELLHVDPAGVSTWGIHTHDSVTIVSSLRCGNCAPKPKNNACETGAAQVVDPTVPAPGLICVQLCAARAAWDTRSFVLALQLLMDLKLFHSCTHICIYTCIKVDNH